MFPDDLDDVAVEALIGGVWTSIRADVRAAGEITITRGRSNQSNRVTPQQCKMWLDNRDGAYSTRNPTSPYYGLLSRNTQIRVRAAHRFGVDTDLGTLTVTEVAPSVDLDTAAGVLLCVWLAADDGGGSFNLTIPGSMTAGTEIDGGFSTSRSGRETLSATGATGTRTATASAATDRWAAVSIAVPGATVQEVLQDVGTSGAGVTLTTAAGTLVGWWLVAVHAMDFAGEFQMEGLKPTGGAGWMPLADTDSESRMMAWARPVTTAGANAVVFPGVLDSPTDTHGHLFVLSGVDALPASTAYRFWGEVAEWPMAWDKSGSDVVVPLEANGVLRRLDRAGVPLRSALFRAATSATSLPLLRAYWPLEDGTRASYLASGIGGKPMRYKGQAPEFANIEPFFGSGPVVRLYATTKLTGDVPNYPHSGSLAARALFEVPAGGFANNTRIMELFQAGGTVARWQIRYGTGGTLTVRALDGDGTQLATSGAIGMGFDDVQTMLTLDLVQNGTGVDWALAGRAYNPVSGDVDVGGLSGTFATQTLGRVFKVQIAPGGAMTDAAVGHVMFGDSAALAASLNSALIGHAGETAGARIERLCAEEGLDVTIVGRSADTAAVGPQSIDTLGNLLFAARDADMGILCESRDSFGLRYRTRTDLYNQTGVELTYTAKHLTAIEVADNDDYITNDYTASRVAGSSERRILDDGALSTQDPPNGVGTYARQDTYNVESDDQLASIANWCLNLGTWDEARYPVLSAELVHPAYAQNPALRAAVAGLELGDVLVINSPPAWLPPDPIEVIVHGTAERLYNRGWQVGWSTSPAGPYYVFVIEHPVYGRLDSGGCELAVDVTSGGTSLLVATDTGVALWDTAAPMPFNVTVGGELMRVTAISGTVSPQTFTVVRSVNTVVKSHTAGTRLRLSRSVAGL